jgi:hypothetical protein
VYHRPKQHSFDEEEIRMDLWRPRNAVRLVFAAAIVGCVAAALLTGRPWLYGVAVPLLYTGWVIFELAARFRERPDDMPVEPLNLDGRENARHLELPWRSSVGWDTYDLSVSNLPGSDWFSDWYKFSALPGDPITIEAEAAVPGPGIEIRLFVPGDGAVPGTTVETDAQGQARLSLVTHMAGAHLVHVRIALQDIGLTQRYRLSISGPSPTSQRPGFRDHASRFDDVPLWHPYHDAIRSLTEQRVLNAVSSSGQPTFAPDLPIWVADFDHALTRGFAGRVGDAGISRAVGGRRGLDEDARTHQADRHSISRAQAISAIVEAVRTASPDTLEGPPSDFSSVFEGAPSVADSSITTAEYNGLLSGVPGLGPSWDTERPLTRGEAAQLIYAATQTIERPRASGMGAPGFPAASRVSGAQKGPAKPGASDAGLGEEFVPGAHKALDALMGDLIDTDLPEDEESVEIDAAAMRATIESVRARFTAQREASQEERPVESSGVGPRTDR